MAMQSSATATKHGVIQSSIALLQERFRQLQREKELRQRKELLKNATFSYPSSDPCYTSTTTTTTTTATAVAATATAANTCSDFSNIIALQNDHHDHRPVLISESDNTFLHHHVGNYNDYYKLFLDCCHAAVSPTPNDGPPPADHHQNISLSLWPVSEQNKAAAGHRHPKNSDRDSHPTCEPISILNLQTQGIPKDLKYKYCSFGSSNDLMLFSSHEKFKSEDHSVPDVDTSLHL